MKYNLAIIDADSLVYLVGSKYKDVRIRSSALNDLDDFIMHILEVNYAKEYVGFFGKVNGAKNFRYDVAKTKPYKGNRGDKEDWYIYWEKIMKNHMEKVWGFIPTEYVEADDMCTMYATKYKGSKDYDKIIICSPDKDLEQLGDTWIYDYWKRESLFITALKGQQNLYSQCIEGDSTDNVLGLMGCGKKAAKLHVANYSELNIEDIHEGTREYFRVYLHETVPAKQRKVAEKAYLTQYKITKGLKRFTKKSKEEALRFFGSGGKIFAPKDTDLFSTQFDEMYSLVYMLRTLKEINQYWKEFKFVEPLHEKFMNWDEIDEKYELMQGDFIEEDFDDDVTFLVDDDFDEFDDL